METIDGSFTIQVRDDGIFLVVVPPESGGSPVEAGQVFDALAERKVTVFDRTAVQEVVGQQSVEIEQGVTVEADLVGSPDQELDRILVVHDHLRFKTVPSVGLLPEFNEALGIE